MQERLFADRMAFSILKRSDKSSSFLKWDDLLMLGNSVFTVRNVEIWAVLYNSEVDLLMLRNRVFRLRNVQISVVRF